MVAVSKYPVIASHFLRYPDCAGWDCLQHKGTLWFRIEMKPGLEIDFYATHLNAWPKHSGIRSAQIGSLVAMVTKHSIAVDQPRPFIVLGDFKSEFESTNYKEIMNNLMLRDSYLEYTRQLTNATPKQASGSSFDIYGNPWAAPEISGEDHPQRLDYVLYRATPATLLRVVESRLCMTEAVQSGRPLSDHYGVSTLFEVTSLVAHASSWDRG